MKEQDTCRYLHKTVYLCDSTRLSLGVEELVDRITFSFANCSKKGCAVLQTLFLKNHVQVSVYRQLKSTNRIQHTIQERIEENPGRGFIY